MVGTRVGYAGGGKDNPTYRDLGDHTETYQVDFDPTVISYADLLRVYWKDHSPTRPMFGRQYMSAIYWHDEEQRRLAEASLEERRKATSKTLYVEMKQAPRFWVAEDYHQKYYLRQTPVLMREFERMYPDPDELVHSTAAARVNGALGGYLGGARLRGLRGRLGLSERAEEMLFARG